MPAPDPIRQLVERFNQQRDAYLSGQYNETQLRREFLDPFFEQLGWDVHNCQGYAEAYKDVIHEDAIRVGGATKAPDYCFRIGGTRKFFVEAKKPSVNLGDDAGPAFQLRRYAWSAKLPLSILTSFNEFAVYDCRIKPDKADKASTARTLYLTGDDYLDRWDEIASIFSRDAILKGSFDRYAASGRRKKGTAEVDDAFLGEIEQWRDELARHIALRNPNLSQRELNFAVQRTIDRIVFLRICEDRGIEEYGQLLALLNGTEVYRRLCEIFYRADHRYNSGLFHFQPEKDRAEPPDQLTLSLAVDDMPLKDILRGLYYPDSPYEFSVLPADILGHVYEQFLGKVIRLTAGHRAVVDEKPEVRKAGGVYYTPTYIVEYIVRNTVGRMLEGKTPKDISAGGGKNAWPLRILDPACGSGSFLLGAYQYLLDWYRDRYVADDPKKWAIGRSPRLFQAAGGEWRLTTAEQKRILLEHIYGVDIDPQAVEVTKLSLLLKVLEGESEETLTRQLRLFGERALPDLGRNIKCGNSLIGPDFYHNHQGDFFDEEERYRINAFDWESEFPEVFPRRGAKDAKKASGFDVVIGNPPYGATVAEHEVYYVRTRYTTTFRDVDKYTLFIEKAVALCRPMGRIGMIVPTGWYSGAKFSALRRFFATHTDPQRFVNLPYDVFKAWVDTTVFITVKRPSPASWPRRESSIVELRMFPKRHRISSAEEMCSETRKVDVRSWFADGNDQFLTSADAKRTRLLTKVQRLGAPLDTFAEVQRGVTPFTLTPKPVRKSSRRAFAGSIRRYIIKRGPVHYIRFDQTIAEPKPAKYFEGERLLLRELISRQSRLQAMRVSEGFVTNKSMQSILRRPKAPHINYLLGLINSRLMSWYFMNRSQIAQRDDFPKIVLKETRLLPIRSVDLQNKSDKPRHDRMVRLVEHMLALHKELAAARTDHDKTVVQRQIDATDRDKTVLQRQIDATDRDIDRLVYDLYGLTDEEIAMVEQQSG